MFDLDKAIEQWKENLQQHSILKQQEVDELHDHLTYLINANLENGMDTEDAFHSADNKIGVIDELSRELLKISFIGRIRRLPKNLLAISLIFILLGLYAIYPTLKIFVENIIASGSNVSLLQNIHNAIMGFLFVGIGVGVFYLRVGFRVFGLIFSWLYLIVNSIMGVFIIFQLLEKKSPIEINLFADKISTNILTALTIIILYYSIGLAMYMWFIHVLNRSEVKLLFGLTKERQGLIKHPIKTFKWLPY